MTVLADRRVRVIGVVLALLLIVLAVGWGQLSARLTGDDITLEVEPMDGIDPLRGAYVDLSYRTIDALVNREPAVANRRPEDRGALFLTLEQRGQVWEATGYSRTRPESGLYLACDDSDWRVRCGIESWYLSEDEVARVQNALRNGPGIATVRIDSRGHAVLIGVALP